MISLQASKSHSYKAPKSEPFLHASSSGHGSTTPVYTETASPITPVLQTTSTQHEQPNHQDDRLGNLCASLHQRIAEFEKVLYSTSN